MIRCLPLWSRALVVALILLPAALLAARRGNLSGRIVDAQGLPVPGAKIRLFGAGHALRRETFSDRHGRFQFDSLVPGRFGLEASAPSFRPVNKAVRILGGKTIEIPIQLAQLATGSQVVSVTGRISPVAAPDPAARLYSARKLVSANPGRPGAPFSIPGLPIATASGGIKAPQYFAPGVAGDHGEPIAQYLRIGNFLFPNNLPANAHGNGYADPNVVIPATIETVQTDAGAFSVEEGNHAVDLGVTYGIRSRIEPFLQLTGDQNDGDLVAGWGPANPSGHEWLALEASLGNGFLKRPEHRRQYKLDGYRQFTLGRHDLTLYGAGYDGFSYLPGLIPVGVPVPDDTIDPRQLDRTHNVMLVATDTWRLDGSSQISFSGFFRDYALALRSNFGDGLIQQSESRTVAGGNATYAYKVREHLSLLAGSDLRRDAPRGLDLKRLDAAGFFLPVTENNVTLDFFEPYVSLDGYGSIHLHYDVGIRQEEIRFHNQDLLRPGNSFRVLSSFTLPKASLTVLPSSGSVLPSLGFSYGSAFHTNDPRIGSPTAATPASRVIAHARAYQISSEKELKQITFRLTLARVTNSAQLAKIDADTGLQENLGPSRIDSLSASAARDFALGSLQVTFSRANARELLTGSPVPEAPRQIWDLLGNVNRLPWKLRVQGEFEDVGSTPLGDGFNGLPIREYRGAVTRPFRQSRFVAGIHFLIASGYTGQTLETLAMGGEPAPFERIVGVPLRSYVALSLVYRLGRLP